MTNQTPEKLRVFLSWSMRRSEAVAQAFRDWLPSVLQNVRPYYTPDDVSKGARWSSEIRAELEASDFGIIFLTPENLASPWILFEAGALSKLEKSKVAPILLGLEATDVSGPLSQLQLTKFSKEECFKLVKSINRALDGFGLEPSVLTNVFEKWWPELLEKVNSAMANAPSSTNENRRTERDLLEEVLERVRGLQSLPRVPTVIGAVRTPISLNEFASRPSPADVSIHELGLTPRTRHSLKDVGARSLEDVLALSQRDLMLTPNFGKTSVMDVERALNRLGLGLRSGNSQDDA
jgi:hypothetical protein